MLIALSALEKRTRFLEAHSSTSCVNQAWRTQTSQGGSPGCFNEEEAEIAGSDEQYQLLLCCALGLGWLQATSGSTETPNPQ